MPIYEYRCPECGVFEVTQRITEDPLEACPTCQGAVKKLISSTSFQLKGTGWYITDYGRSHSDANGDKRETNGTADSADSRSAESKAPGSESSGSRSPEKSSSGDTASSSTS